MSHKPDNYFALRVSKAFVEKTTSCSLQGLVLYSTMFLKLCFSQLIRFSIIGDLIFKLKLSGIILQV